jgi:ribonuclease BN (tRNA processing enzyme)
MRVLALAVWLAAAAAAQDTRVILLGTGNPNPEPERSGPAVAVVTGDRAYIVDCGPGVVRRAAQAGLQMEQLTRAFVTHLHSDHTAGLPDLILTPAVTGRLVPFEIYGPPGLRAMVRHVMQGWREDIRVRLDGLEPAVRAAYTVRARDGKPGEIYRDEAVRVTAFPVPHGSWKHAYGYVFETGGKKIVISGDTTVSDRVAEAARGCDILVHECYSQKGWEGRTPEWRKYHAAVHTSAPDLGKLAARARPRKLVLYHQLPMGQSPEQMLREVREHFTGEVVYGRDLDVVR